jgi:glucose/arabinose dehydrogenase
MKSRRHFRINAATVVLLLVVGLSSLIYFILREVDSNLVYEPSKGAPSLETSVLLDSLDHAWDTAEAPDGTIVFTERAQGVSILRDGHARLLEKPDDLEAQGEGGMMGLALDPQFERNHFFYICYTTQKDVRVVRIQVKSDWSAVSSRQNLITDMPKSPSGRHSGCRPRFGPDGFLWIGTGDAAQAKNPQDPKSLGGKILRVTRDGQPALGNLTDPFDPRIHSYGHRNTQGLAFDPSPPTTPEGRPGIVGYSVEHGPGRDDEINKLTSGNFGWSPTGTYNEDVPMTDTQKFPEAIEAAWSSGNPTIAPSGATFIDGQQWGDWDGALAVAVLKNRHLRIFTIDDNGKLHDEAVELTDYGRLRSVTQLSDGALLVTTDNGNGKDQILKVTVQ